MLSKEREQEIWGSVVRHAHVTELLDEIDRLKERIKNLREAMKRYIPKDDWPNHGKCSCMVCYQREALAKDDEAEG